MTFWENNIIIDVKEIGNVLEFSFGYLLQASTWGLYPPQPVSQLGHAPSLCPILLIGSGYF